MNSFELLGGLAGLFGAAVAVITALSSARKHEVEALREIIEELRAWRDDARTRITDLEREVREWKSKYFELCKWIREQGLHPPKWEQRRYHEDRG